MTRTRDRDLDHAARRTPQFDKPLLEEPDRPLFAERDVSRSAASIGGLPQPSDPRRRSKSRGQRLEPALTAPLQAAVLRRRQCRRAPSGVSWDLAGTITGRDSGRSRFRGLRRARLGRSRHQP